MLRPPTRPATPIPSPTWPSKKAAREARPQRRSQHGTRRGAVLFCFLVTVEAILLTAGTFATRAPVIVKRSTSWLLASTLIACLVMGLEGDSSLEPRPRSFGIDHSMDDIPENPRDYRNGEFGDLANWAVSKEVPNDVFTFARLRYPSYNDGGGGFGRRRGRGGGGWRVDYPDSDMNFSFRLQQMTSLQVNPNAAVVDIEPGQLRHYPFLYMLEVGQIDLQDEQARALRDYMLNGGFILVDDFWGTDEWDTFYRAFKQIWPDREFVELELDHEIFHSVFDLKVKPMIPGISVAMQQHRGGGSRFYEWYKPGAETVHYRAVYDDQKRMCMLVCWNTDMGDGWEEEGTDPWYFREFSEKYAYPMGINIIYYAMTH